MNSEYKDLREKIRGIFEGEETGGIFDLLRDTGDHILEGLNPPPGLRAWLHAKGMSLIPTRDPDEEHKPSWEEYVTEEEARNPSIIDWHEMFQLGDQVRYSTAVGPKGWSSAGAGPITSHTHDEDGMCQFFVGHNNTDGHLVCPELGDTMGKY